MRWLITFFGINSEEYIRKALKLALEGIGIIPK